MTSQPKRQRASDDKILQFAPDIAREKFSVIEATERAIIGLVFHEPELYPALSNIIQAADFYFIVHGYFWWAFEQAFPAIDQIRIINLLKDRDTGREDIVSYVNGFLMNASDSRNAEHLALLIREQAIRRRMFVAAKLMQDAIFNPDLSLDAQMDQCNHLLFEATEQGVSSPATSAKALVSELWDELESGELASGIPTGFTNLDAILEQFYAGEVTLLAGHPGMGKTSMLLSFLLRACRKDRRVVMFTMEMTRHEIIKILAGMEAEVSRTSILRNAVSADEWRRFIDAAKRIADWKLDVIDEFRDLTPTQLRRKLRLLTREQPIDLLVLDGLWLMKADEHGQDRWREVHDITTNLVSIAKDEFNLPILISHQYNQDVKTRADKRPIINDIAEGASIMRNLQLILAMHRENYYDKDSVEDTTRVYILKDRNRGKQGQSVDFGYRYGQFMEVEKWSSNT